MSFLKPQNKTERIVLTSVVGVVLLFVFIIIFTVIFSSPSIKEQYLRIVQQQEEIVRIADIGQNTSRNRETNSIAVTAQSTVSSAQRRTIELIEQNGETVSKADRKGRESSQTTDRLNTARQANRFDEVFLELLEQELTDYQASLKRVYNRSDSQSARTTLQEMYTDADVILQSIASTEEQ